MNYMSLGSKVEVSGRDWDLQYAIGMFNRKGSNIYCMGCRSSNETGDSNCWTSEHHLEVLIYCLFNQVRPVQVAWWIGI